VYGFDEFFGNLYHFNAEEEPENPDYPKDLAFRAKFGPRGVLKCTTRDTDDPTLPAPGFAAFISKRCSSSCTSWRRLSRITMHGGTGSPPFDPSHEA
jgi:hypothetical protein